MKIDTKLLLVLGISIAAGGVILLLIWLVSLLSWGIVYVLITFSLVLPVYSLIQIYINNDCFDLEDLWDVISTVDEEKKDSQSITVYTEDDDYRKYP